MEEGGLMRHSHHRLVDFLNCNLLYKLRYLDKLSTDKSDATALTLGSAVHKFIEDYSEHCIRNKVGSDHAYVIGHRDSYIIDLHPDSLNDYYEIIDTFEEKHRFDIDGSKDMVVEGKVAFDKNWERCEWNDKSAMFRGIIDRYYVYADTINITDYKTNRRIKPFSEVKNDFQLKTYAWMCHLLYPDMETFLASLDFVRYGVVIGPVKFNIDQVIQIGKYIDFLIKKIENNKEWEPSLGSHCEYCGYTHICPAFAKSEMRNMEEMDADTAMDNAEWLYVYERKTKNMKEHLKDWVEKNESSILVGDMDLDFHFQSEKKVKNLRKLYEDFIRLGVDEDVIWDNLSISKTAAERIMKLADKRKLIQQLMKEHFEDKGKTQFRFKKG